jgi:hypothetical protein
MFGILDPALRKLAEALDPTKPERNPYADPRNVLMLPKWKPHLFKSGGRWHVRPGHPADEPAHADGFGNQVCAMRAENAVAWRNWMNDPRGRHRPPHYSNRKQP